MLSGLSKGLEILTNPVKGLLDVLNPISENFFLKQLFSWFDISNENFIFKDLFSWLDPTSENFILKKIWDFLTNIVSYLNPMHENFFGKKLVELIGDLLNKLFVPQQDHFGELNEKFHSKFGFIDQIKDLVTNLFNFNESRSSSDVPPDWSITYYGTTVNIIDWTAFEKYRGFLHGIIIFILWGSFLIRLYKRIPGIVHGYYVSHGDK